MKALSFSVILYMLIALAWWSVLINKKNTEAFVAKCEIIAMQNEKIYGVKNYDISQEAEYLDLRRKYVQQQYMIFGEAAVFGIMLVVGIWLINRSFERELATGRRQQNFLLSITHELKTPLASIGLIFDTIRRRELPLMKLKELAATGADEKLRLEKLINNLLMAAKIDTAQEYHLEPIALSSIIEELAQKYRQVHVHTTIHIDIPSSLSVSVDREAFVSVITNLLENAIKYRDSSRQLHIRITARAVSEMVEIAVEDNGIGIDTKERKHIFDKFYRVGAEETRTTKGTGLGLFIVKKIVERHNGSIAVNEAQPHGSIFVTTWQLTT